MKRLFLTVMAVLSMTMTFAEDENLNTTNNMQAYNMEVNYNKLGEALDLTSDQLEAVKDVHQMFCTNMMSVAAASEDEERHYHGPSLHAQHSQLQAVQALPAAAQHHTGEPWTALIGAVSMKREKFFLE